MQACTGVQNEIEYAGALIVDNSIHGNRAHRFWENDSPHPFIYHEPLLLSMSTSWGVNSCRPPLIPQPHSVRPAEFHMLTFADGRVCGMRSAGSLAMEGRTLRAEGWEVYKWGKGLCLSG